MNSANHYVILELLEQMLLRHFHLSLRLGQQLVILVEAFFKLLSLHALLSFDVAWNKLALIFVIVSFFAR